MKTGFAVTLFLLSLGSAPLFGSGLQLFTDPALIQQRNSSAGLKQLMAQAWTNLQADPESYDYNWQYAGVMYFYGDFYLKDKKSRKYYFNQARIYARKATQLNPSGVEGHFLMGVASAMWAESNGVLQSLFMADDVARYMSRVIELDPAFYQGIPWAIRAQVYGLAPGKPISVGDHTRAYSDFVNAYKYNQGYRVVYQLNAYMLMQHKKWTEADQVVTKALAFPRDTGRPREEMIAFQKLTEYQAIIRKNLNP